MMRRLKFKTSYKNVCLDFGLIHLKHYILLRNLQTAVVNLYHITFTVLIVTTSSFN